MIGVGDASAEALRGAVDRALAEADRTGWHWRYLPNGKRAHVLRLNSMSGGLDVVAACGIGAWPSDWLGTGSQTEYEQAATLPRCRRCIRRTIES